MTQHRVLCFGELLIDMISTTTGSLIDSEGFLRKFGGAPANAAMGLAKLGTPVSFMGKVGDDHFGHFLKRTLEKYKVNTDTLILSKKNNTTLAFVSLEENGERHFSFYRGAHEAIRADEVSLPADITLLHFGSLTQTNEQCNQATMKLVSQANKRNIILSYDPNIRETLWNDMEHARSIILDTVKHINILKLDEEEACFLSGRKSLEDAAETLYTPNMDALFITRAAKGCYYKTQLSQGLIPTISVKAIDTTGAGDAFNAGYIYARVTAQKNFSDMTSDEISFHLKRSTIIASLTTTKKGAITAFPTPDEWDAVLIQTT